MNTAPGSASITSAIARARARPTRPPPYLVVSRSTSWLASVQVGVAGGRVHLQVADDGGGDPAALQPGRGILGMHERAAMHGGRVVIDRDRQGRFVITAELTWEAPP